MDPIDKMCDNVVVVVVSVVVGDQTMTAIPVAVNRRRKLHLPQTAANSP